MPAIFPIVEGHGEVSAVPILLRRLASEAFVRHDVEVLHPYRLPRGRMVAEDAHHLRSAVELGRRKIVETGGAGFVLILLDADDDCPAQLGPALLRRIARPDVAASVVLAKREYEAWFLAAAATLRGHRLVSSTAVAPPDPEDVRNAKQYFERELMVPGAVYRETVDQPALTAIMGLDQARASLSFDKLCRDLLRLLAREPRAG